MIYTATITLIHYIRRLKNANDKPAFMTYKPQGPLKTLCAVEHVYTLVTDPCEQQLLQQQQSCLTGYVKPTQLRLLFHLFVGAK